MSAGLVITVDAWSFDPADPVAASPRGFAERVEACILESHDAGARIILLPEFLWMGLARFEPDISRLARLFWDELWPEVARGLPSDLFVVAGTAPQSEAGSSCPTNRAVLGAGFDTTEKRFLTPWESGFAPGSALPVHKFAGLRIAVLICLDVEVPGLAAGLRRHDIDLLLVPSATETALGVERVNRCASARAVELGCAVVVSPLTGRGPCELIDRNLGRCACYLPAQAPLAAMNREDAGELQEAGTAVARYRIDFATLRACRAGTDETNPSRLDPRGR